MKRYIILFAVLGGFVQQANAQEKLTVEKYAQYPGGGEKFFEYIKNELKYPADALKDSITGDVHVNFVVSKTGEILDETVKVEKGLSASCDAEAIRIIKKAPNWLAGTGKSDVDQKIISLEQQITFPVTFTIPKK